jgi:hypothetical protein
VDIIASAQLSYIPQEILWFGISFAVEKSLLLSTTLVVYDRLPSEMRE